METLLVSTVLKIEDASGDKIAERYNTVSNVKNELLALKDDLPSIDSWAEKLDMVNCPCKEMLVWSQSARELSYDVNHCLDEFFCEQDSFARELMLRFRLADIVKRLRMKLSLLVSAYRSHNWDQLTTTNLIHELSCRASSVIEQENGHLLGRKGQLDELFAMLFRDPTLESDRLKIISIVGSGGSGKTALAVDVFSSSQQYFDCHASVGVSGSRNMQGLLLDLWMQLARNEPLPEMYETNYLLRKLNGLLATKRYLVLLDDLWKPDTWTNLKAAFPANKLGSRILLTTRIKEVAITCSASDDFILQMSPLEDGDSRKLFLRSIYGFDKCPEQFEDKMRLILNKCGGNPLMILKIASHLLGRGATRMDAWEEISKLNCFSECSGSEALRSLGETLSLSYTLLPRYLKPCALFLAGFPQGFTIDVDVAMFSWMAEDFVSSRSTAEAYIDELIGCHLIEPVRVGADGKVESVRIARLVHEMLWKNSCDKGFYTVPSRTMSKLKNMKLNRVFFVSEDAEFVAARHLSLQQTRTIVIYPCQSIPSLDKCKYLRVLLVHLSTSFSSDSVKTVAKLANLKVLVLNTSSVRELPCQIGSLQKLEALVMWKSSMHTMPNSYIRFEYLVCLKVGKVAFPPGLSRLQRLERIETFDLGASACEAIAELGKLHSLKVLSLFWNVELVSESVTRLANISESIRELLSEGRLEQLKLKGESTLLHFLSFFQPNSFMPTLRKLHMESKLYMRRVPSCVTSFCKLTDISISIESLVTDDIALLGDLPLLIFMKFWIKSGPAAIEFGERNFPQLRSLLVSSDEMELKFNMGCISGLERLHLITSSQPTLVGLRNVVSLRTLYVSIACASSDAALDVRTAVNEAAARSPKSIL